jgi:NAD-dependent DNA ligase
MKPRAPRTKKNVASSEEELIQSFAQHGISVLESLSESQLSAIIRKANDVYYNASSVSSSSSDPLLTDAQYDIIKEYIERKFPANTAIKEVGAKIVKNKVVLPYEMASMDKIKPESGALAAWTAKYKGPYILSAKLDGVSGLYTCEGATPQLYTRGDGKVGQDVSHLTRVLSLPCIPGLVVRGEFILRKAVFETKYKGTFATARNLVAGIVNAKTIDDKTRDLDFVVYEVIKPVIKPSKQMETLLSHGFKTVWHTTSKTLSNEMLSDVLQDTRAKYEYETDGIIVANDAVYPRSTGNPEHAFAFKMVIGDQMAEAKVVDVLWEVSQDGYLKPRIRIEPVNIAGVNIEYTTGFNGKFIEENGIGVGAVVRIIRSGDVIPYIREVIAPAKAKMPEVPYVWTATRVDIMVENAAEDPAVKRKNVVGFFLELDIKGLGESNLKKIVEAGHDSVAKILALPLATLEKVFGKGKTAPALYEGIRARMESVTLGELMTASNMFGRGIGRKSVDALLEAHPDFLTSAENKVYKLEVLAKVGVKKNGEQFYDAIVPFVRFLEECGLSGKLMVSVKEPDMKESAIDSPLYNKSVVMTKVRDAEIIDFLKRVGATLDDAMKTTTFVLIVKDRGDVSSKTKYAEARGIPIMTVEEFKGQYF